MDSRVKDENENKEMVGLEELSDIYNANVFSVLHQATHLPDDRQMRIVFDRFDTTQDGLLSREDIVNMLHHFYESAIDDAVREGASEGYIKKARTSLESEWGRKVFEEAADEILKLRDDNGDGLLSFEEFSAHIHVARKHGRGRYWRLAPLADVKVDMDIFTNGPYHKFKVFGAGAVAGLLAKTASSPLARVTILMQTGGLQTQFGKKITGSTNVVRSILGAEGIRGLFRGNFADVLRAVPYSGLQYIAYENYKRLLVDYDRTQSKLFARIVAGGFAGGTAILATYPLDLIRARLCVQSGPVENQKYKGISHAFRTIFREEGWRALYRGAGTAVAERVPNMAINYSVYDILRNSIEDRGHSGLFVSLACGASAGIASTIATFPVDLVMRNLQVDGRDGKQTKFSGPIACAQHVWQKGGFRGFYRGLGAQLAKALPYTMVAWASYDAMRRVLDFEVR